MLQTTSHTGSLRSVPHVECENERCGSWGWGRFEITFSGTENNYCFICLHLTATNGERKINTVRRFRER